MKKSMYYADSDTVHCVVVEKLNFPKYSFFFLRLSSKPIQINLTSVNTYILSTLLHLYFR